MQLWSDTRSRSADAAVTNGAAPAEYSLPRINGDLRHIHRLKPFQPCLNQRLPFTVDRIEVRRKTFIFFLLLWRYVQHDPLLYLGIHQYSCGQVTLPYVLKEHVNS